MQQTLRGVKRRQRQVSSQLASIDVKLERTESRLAAVSGDVTRAQDAVVDATRECEAAEERLAAHCGSLSARLVAIYQRGEVQPVEVLLQATSFADFANRVYLLDQVVERDGKLLAEYEQARAEAEAQQAERRAREEGLVQLR